MPDISALARLLAELEDQLLVCMRCGLCQSVCPLFAETGREADVARGKLALLDGLRQEIFANPQGVMERLNRCLLCGSCAAHCPSGVRTMDIFIKARAILTGYRGLSPLKKVIFRGLLSRPEFFNLLLSWSARLQGFLVRPVDNLLGSSCARFLSPLLQDRHFRPLAAVPLHRRVSSINTTPAPGKPRVALFIGCLIDKIFPEVGQAVLRVLEHHRVGVLLPEDQGCCGIPALSAGDPETFQQLLRHHLERFAGEPFDYLVTACATCSATLKMLWPLMTQDIPEASWGQVAFLAEKTLDIHQFLVDVLKLGGIAYGDVRDGLPVTYHDPCHLRKTMGVAAQPRVLVAANPSYRLVEMPEADWCCGCGGSFTLQHYEVSAAIGRRKRDNILKSGAHLVATACPACMLQMIDTLSQAGAPVQVRHVMEIYAESLT